MEIEYDHIHCGYLTTKQNRTLTKSASFTIIICLLVAALAGGVVWYINNSEPVAQRETATKRNPMLAVAFRSYFQPLIVFGAVPFGIVGAVIGHILLGYDLSLVSLMGIIAPTGVVVNDALIMITHANRQLERLTPFEAIREAAVTTPSFLDTCQSFDLLP